MAEESINLQMTSATPDEGTIRRNSTGKKVSSNSGEKLVPHYLRASTGSCHDFCKYGRKHAFEEKARHSLPKRLAAKLNDSRSAVETIDSPGRKRSSMVKFKNSSDSRTRSPNAPSIYKQQPLTRSLDSLNVVRTDFRAERKKTSLVKLEAASSSKPRTNDALKSMKQKLSASTEKLEVSSKKGSTEAKPKSFPGKRQTSLKPKSVPLKPLPSTESSGRLNGNGDTRIGKRTGTPGVALKKVPASPTVLLSPRPSLSRVASLNRKQRSLKKVLSPLKNHNRIRKAEPTESKNDEVPEKTLYVIKMETENNTLESDQNETCETQVESLPHPSSLSPEPSSLPDSPSSSPHEDEEEEEEAEAEEEEEEEDQQESEYTVSESEDNTSSENNETESMENSGTPDMNNKMRKSSELVCAEDDDDKASKLKFRRGKVVDMQPENNAPRRLKFRRGRVLENQNVTADARRRRFKRREEVDGDSAETGAEKVVLKHQDVQGKKDAQGLFNNVIEETASKLVETRKSKVKALVGAFETVISLQDKKPSANTVS
ncbi:Calmodulin-binding domain [Trema orientale]|uniref:Calmodulin-binding domain n=1 Tax=Trema orientale TaxID=63057 RepID=A0A2P5FEU7_TREOI|nr:Calmodulin-binding domain [Trema orientale]